MIIFMKLIDGNWWHGAMDFTDNPRVVERYRNLISSGLMRQTGG
jgi:hypothetical protein